MSIASLSAHEGSSARRERRRVGEGPDVGRRRRLLLRRRRRPASARAPQAGEGPPPAPPGAAGRRPGGHPAATSSTAGPRRARRPGGARPRSPPRPATDQSVLVHVSVSLRAHRLGLRIEMHH